ncbi:MAG: bifunctional 4-hydroxy-2-oxoglutarate aldolase/2-dehydro-3-deoxy-phosphogluconate aldolase [Promethearchaeota archaeon]
MARFNSINVYQSIMEQGLVPVFYNGEIETAKNIVKAIANGGGKIVEFTNRGDFAYRIFYKLVEYFKKEEPQLIFGVGSIFEPYTASLYINNGANFIVGPILNPKIAKLCNRRRIPYIPGCATPSEISKAEELGCEIIKIFPGNLLGGPNFVKSILAPSPWTKIMPTGGVGITKESLHSWFEAGVVAVGIGSNLITKDSINSQDWDGITENVKKVLNIIKKLKKKI